MPLSPRAALSRRSVRDLAASGKESHLALTVSVPGLELVKDVTVTFGPSPTRCTLTSHGSIHWKPQAGPYPEFDGELTVRADETYKSALLELTGSYRPPGGALGAAFDWAAGSRIARATARALLARIGDEMESRYKADEKAKQSSSCFVKDDEAPLVGTLRFVFVLGVTFAILWLGDVRSVARALVMHIHRYERWWLTFGLTMLVVFLSAHRLRGICRQHQSADGDAADRSDESIADSAVRQARLAQTRPTGRMKRTTSRRSSSSIRAA